MTIAELEKSGWIIYKCIRGSQAYGLATPKSDIDYAGIYIQPTNQILRGDYIPQISDEKSDIIYYEIERFIELACKGNPNVLDLLATSSEHVVFESPLFKKYFPDLSLYLTKQLRHTFTGYAMTQIKKAKGFNKKHNWDKDKVTRKGVLDFCYCLLEREKSVRFKKWKEIINSRENEYTLPINENTIGLSKVNNFPGVYSMYFLGLKGGIIRILGNESNEVQVRDIPKDSDFLGYLQFDKNAYSTHCKTYREYQDWILKRNPVRHENNLKGEQGFDKKNMQHCIRLLLTAKDIAEKKQLIIQRPEREYLLSIKHGEIGYNEILEKAE